MAQQDQQHLGRIAYEAYVRQAGGVSLISQTRLPPWDKLSQDIKAAWIAAAEAVRAESRRAAIESLKHI